MLHKRISKESLKVRTPRYFGRRSALLTAFFFPILICCIGFAGMGVWPFGRYSALVIDGVHQYLGFYEELANQVGKGLDWTFSGHALGYSFFSLFSYYLSSPFNLLILLLMKVLYVNDAVTIVMLLKIGLIGLCMAWYMGKKLSGRWDIAACAGCMYALSNYVLGYYSNLMWLDCVMLTPVLAWSLEELVGSGAWKRYALVLGYCIFSNYYMGFMLCVFSVLYYLALLGMAGRPSGSGILIKGILKFAGASLLAGGLAAGILFPAAFAIAKTTAAREVGLAAGNGVYGNIWEQFGRLLFDSLPYATSGDQASVNLYCGCAVLPFLGFFFLNRGIRWQKKLAMGALLVFYFAGFHFQILNLLLHGMHRPVGMPNRFAFLFIFLLISVFGEAWAMADRMGKEALAIGTAAALFFCDAVGAQTGKIMILGSMSLILLYCILLAKGIGLFDVNAAVNVTGGKEKGIGRPKERKRKWQTFLCVLLLCEIGLHGVFGIYHIGSAGRNRYVDSRQELKQVMSAKSDRNLYRADIVNPVLRNEELLYGLNGISMFSSTNTDSMQTWMEKMGFETATNRFQYAGSTEVTDMLLGVKYLACRKGLRMDTAYTKTYSGKFFDLYENPRALASAYLVDAGIRNFRLDGKNPFEVQNELLKGMGYGEAFRTEEVRASDFRPQSMETVFEIPLKGGEYGYLLLNGEEPSVANVNGRVQQAGSWNNAFLDLGYSDRARTVSVSITKRLTKALLGTVTKSELNGVYQDLSRHILRLENGGGEIRADQDSVIFFPLFYDEGLHVQVDGQQVETLNLEGMLGVPVSKGNHTVSLAYDPPGLKIGMACSLLSVILWLALTGQTEIYHSIRKNIFRRRLAIRETNQHNCSVSE